MVKLYGILWAVVLFAMAATTISGSLNEMALVVFGLIIFSMIFMGMISVLPTTIAHPAPKKIKAEPVKKDVKILVQPSGLTTR